MPIPARRPRIAVVGAGSCDEALSESARRVGRGLAEAGAIVICGGLGGVMEAAARGAGEAGGMSLGILPGTRPDDGNRYLTLAVATGLGEARNALVVLNADAVIAVGGGYGTLSEIALARKRGIPVVGLGTWRLETAEPLVIEAEGPEEAVAAALRLAERAGAP